MRQATRRYTNPFDVIALFQKGRGSGPKDSTDLSRIPTVCQKRSVDSTALSKPSMPRWAPLGGLAGAFAVVAGLMFVDKVGAGTFAGLTITPNILISLVTDKFGFFGMEVHPLGIGRIAGGALMVAGIVLVAKF